VTDKNGRRKTIWTALVSEWVSISGSVTAKAAYMTVGGKWVAAVETQLKMSVSGDRELCDDGQWLLTKNKTR